MKLFGTEIKLNRSSNFILDGEDKVTSCKFTITDDGIGTDTPIVLNDNSVFNDNLILTEIACPILVNSPSTILNNNTTRVTKVIK